MGTYLSERAWGTVREDYNADADTGRGLGASHQTGWTALVALLLQFRGDLRFDALHD